MVWPALTGLSRAKEFLFLGERISAQQAVELGLATRVIAADELMSEAVSLAKRLAKVPAAALRNTKRALNAYLEAQLPGAFERAFAGELESMHSSEHRDSVAAARIRSAKRAE
jgi:enoyl-CoA hydratase